MNKSTAKGGRIDLHHHHVPPGLGGFGGAGRGGGGRGPGNLQGPWTPEITLEQMDKFDIAVSILSMTQMGDVLYDNTAKHRRGRAARALRRRANSETQTVAEHPKRFGLFTGVPLPDIEYGLNTLKADFDTLKAWREATASVSTPTTIRPTIPAIRNSIPCWQRHPQPAPCMSASAALHPNLNDSVSLNDNESSISISRDFDTSILCNGILHKYPNLKIIIPHSTAAPCP